MKEIIEKLSSYNIFNYLLPGTLFAFLAEKTTAYAIIQRDILIGMFLYYFIGLVISRLGSLVVAPLLRKIDLVSCAPYDDFVKASAKDSKLETLSEANNTYRTLIALFVAIGLLKTFEATANGINLPKSAGIWILVALLTVLFVLSYRKQTSFIVSRVRAQKDD